MKRLRLALISILVFIITSVVAAGPSWMPLPPVAGGDPGDGVNSWFPTVQVACNQVNISMNPPTFFFINDSGYQEVEWRFINLYDVNGGVIPTTPSQAYGTDPRSIGEWTDDTTKQAVFNITTPVQPGIRAYGEFQFRLRPMGDPQNPPPYNDWNATIFQVGDRTHDDFMARAYVSDYSVARFGDNYDQLSCDPAYDLNNAGTNPPTISLDQNGNPSAVPEGNSGQQEFVYKLNLSAPSSRTVTAHVSVGGTGGNSELRPTGGYLDWDDANEEGVDHDLKNANGVLVANTLDYRVAYPFGCGTGASYCDLGIDAQPPFMHEIVFAPGETSKTFTVVVYGDTVIEHDQTVSIRIHDVSHALFGATTQLGLTMLDDDEPTISVANTNVVLDECAVANGQAAVYNVPLVLSHAVSGNLYLYHFTYPGSAIPGEDYLTINTEPMNPPFVSLTLPSGQTLVNVPITYYGDAISEYAETFTLEMINAVVEYENVTPSRTEPWGFSSLPGKLQTSSINFTIPANGPNVSISDASLTEGNSGQTNMQFTVTLAALAKDQGGNDRGVTIYYRTVDGTAIAGGDYVGTQSGSVVVLPGSTTATISIPIIGDTNFEPNETFTVELTGTDGACIQDGSATGTINNDDSAPTVNILDTSAAESSGQMTFTVQLSATSSQPVTMNYATSDGTAQAETDYVAASGPLTIPANTLSTTITIDLIDNATLDDGLTFNVTLSNISGATAGDISAVGTILDDDRPANLDIQGDLAEAPLDLVFTWTHQPAPGGTGAPGDWYHLLISRDAQMVVDKWFPVANVCSGTNCGIVFQDFAVPYILTNGSYEWVIEAYKNGTTISSLPAEFVIAFNTPAQPVITQVTTTYGQPTVYWNRDANASWYQVQILNAAESVIFNKWVQKHSNCTTGCVLATNTVMPQGSYYARVRGWGPMEFGESSVLYPFTIDVSYPDAPDALLVLNPEFGMPTFEWAGSSNATWYQLAVTITGTNTIVLDKWYKAEDTNCVSGGTCTITPPLNLANASYSWWVQAWGPAGYNGGSKQIWTKGPDFMVAIPAPEQVTGLNALDPDTGEPTFEWTHSANATWYQLVVSKSGLVFQKWYPEADLGCGSGTCSIKPPIYLQNGDYTWAVRAWGPGGYNAGDPNLWSTDKFSVEAPSTGIPTLIAPGGETSDPTPEFSWNSVNGATWYQVWVEYNGARIYEKWLPASELNCAGGGVCAKTEPTINLNPGGYVWKVRAYSPAGTGGWSETTTFQVVP
jgi:hypothetical protein